jgi:hypothetical protein
MVKVNIPVTGPDMNWIVGRLAKELVDRLPRYGFDARSTAFERRCDVEYHSNVYGPPSGTWPSKHRPVRTRRRPAGQFATQFDGHVC